MSTTTIIGKILPDGQVKYIRCSDRESLRVTARILLRFYRRESRLDALLELGNVQYLGPSPYGRSAGPADEVHCIACIRDNNESEQEYRSEIITGKEIFLKANCPAFLYEQDRWLLAWENGIPNFTRTKGWEITFLNFDNYGYKTLRQGVQRTSSQIKHSAWQYLSGSQ